MWFVDVVIDLLWFTEKKGKLGKPKSRSRQLIPGTNVENEFLLYGDEHAIRHLRVMLHTEADQPPHDMEPGAVNDAFAHLGLTHTAMPHDHWRVWQTARSLGLTAD